MIKPTILPLSEDMKRLLGLPLTEEISKEIKYRMELVRTAGVIKGLLDEEISYTAKKRLTELMDRIDAMLKENL